MSAKMCVVCGGPLPFPRRADCRYCGGTCQVRAYRIRDRHPHGQPNVRRRAGQPALDVLQQQLDYERSQRQQQEGTITELRAQLGRAEAACASADQQIEQHLGEAQVTKAELAKARNSLDFYKSQLQSQFKRNVNLYKELATNKKTPCPNRKKAAPTQQQRRLAAKEQKAEQREWQDFEKKMKASEPQCAELEPAQRREAADPGEVQRLTKELQASQYEGQKLRIQKTVPAPQETKTLDGILSTVGTAFLGGLAACVGYKAAEVLETSTRGAPRTLPARTVPAEVVQMIPDTEDGRQLPTQRTSLALPPKSKND